MPSVSFILYVVYTICNRYNFFVAFKPLSAQMVFLKHEMKNIFYLAISRKSPDNFESFMVKSLSNFKSFFNIKCYSYLHMSTFSLKKINVLSFHI